MSHQPTWVAIVHGLQIGTLVTWTYPVLDKASSVWRVLAGRPKRWDSPWAALWFLALTQWGYSVRWLIYPAALDGMPTRELVMWAGLYSSSAMTCIGMIWTQGLRAGPARNRRALIAHLCLLLLCVAAAVAVR